MRDVSFVLLVVSTLCCASLGGCRGSEPDDRARRAARAQLAEATQRQQASPMAPAAMTPSAPTPMAPSPSPNVAPNGEPAAPTNPALLNPTAANETAPGQFTVELDTTKGTVILDVHRDWSPRGADRFYNLVKIGFYTDVAMFRVIEGFMAQGGIHGDPNVSRVWRSANIQDDPKVEGRSNTRGMVSYAMGGPNTRTSQFFISFVDNSRLDAMGFTPFAQVRNMDIVDRLYAGYGEGAPAGRGPRQALIQSQGNTYLRRDFPNLDYIRSARVTNEGR